MKLRLFDKDTLNHMVYGEFNIDGSRETSIESSEQIIAEYYDRILGKEITLNTESNLITIHLQERTLADKVSELSEQLTQAQADIAYISVLSDIDTTTEEETPNESSI